VGSGWKVGYFFSEHAVGVGTFAGETAWVETILGIAHEEGFLEVEEFEDGPFGISFAEWGEGYELLPSERMGLPGHCLRPRASKGIRSSLCLSSGRFSGFSSCEASCCLP
jgi:hypothetical protein